MSTIDVKDATGTTVTIQQPLAPGRAAAAASRPVVLSTEDLAAVNAITTALGTTNTDIGSTNTKLDTLHTDLGTTNTDLSSALTKLDTLHTDIGTTLHGDFALNHSDLGGINSQLVNGITINAEARTGGVPNTARLSASAASTNATRVKSSNGRVYAIEGKNVAAYDVFLVLYDSAVNPPVPGTTTIRKKICIPAGAAFELKYQVGLSFATGIGYAFTKLVADSDTTAIAANDIIAFNMDYA